MKEVKSILKDLLPSIKSIYDGQKAGSPQKTLLERRIKAMALAVQAIDYYEKGVRDMNKDIQAFNNSQSPQEREICDLLAKEIDHNLPEAENKIWHAHPVWFFDGNPIVGYSKLKAGIRLFFWSGVGFEEEQLMPGSGKFKDASILYTSVNQINTSDLQKWLDKSRNIQWDYKNIRKKKGVLEKLK